LDDDPQDLGGYNYLPLMESEISEEEPGGKPMSEEKRAKKRERIEKKLREAEWEIIAGD